MNIITLPSKPRYWAKDTAVNKASSVDVQKPIADVHIDAACPICQEPVGQPTPEGKAESWSKLPCGHKFGSHCIKYWLGLRTEDKPCCPICRRNVAHLCGHPALPELIASPGRRNTSDIEISAAEVGKPDMTQYTNCVFCRQGIGGTRKKRAKKRYKPWRFVKGCWCLVRHGRIRARPMPNREVTMWPPWCQELRDLAWKRWWIDQEPRSV